MLATTAAGHYVALSDAIPQLKNLTSTSPSSYAPLLGGMNLTHCCLLAVNSSFEIRDGNLALVNNSFFSPDITASSFLSVIESGQFPCGAIFNGDDAGAPVVRAAYEWIENMCPGWQISQPTKLQQWIGPLVGFILVSLVFCLSIPRKRKLEASDSLFMPLPDKAWSFLFTPVGFLVAALVVTIDMLLWLSLCFAFAGPMILSGVYEAFLDHRILKFLKAPPANLGTDEKAKLLFIILVGNLDLRGNEAVQFCEDEESGLLEGPWDDVEGLVSELGQQKSTDKADKNELQQQTLASRTYVIELKQQKSLIIESLNEIEQRDSSKYGDGTDMVQQKSAVVEITNERDRQGSTDSEDTIVPDLQGDEIVELRSQLEHGENAKSVEMQRRYKAIARTKTALRTMLGTQNSFGMAVGVPIVFFVGAFIYTVFDILSRLGDNDTAHALAFGMWWMTIPHIAIISSLLLAGNNPNAFEGLVGKTALKHPPVFKLFALSYESRYKTEWMWLRGRNKQRWIQKALHNNSSESLTSLYRATTFKVLDWAKMITTTIILIATPLVLAFLTSYYTPRIGVSCRSLTSLVYGISQTLQIALWAWAYLASAAGSGNEPHSQANLARPTLTKTFSSVAWWALAAILGATSIFTAIGGTIMQLLGVYRNCLCALPLQYWGNRGHPDAWVSLGTNSRDDIIAAKTWWVPLGAAAVAFLGLSCYWGWWYQKRLRGAFRDAAEKIG